MRSVGFGEGNENEAKQQNSKLLDERRERNGRRAQQSEKEKQEKDETNRRFYKLKMSELKKKKKNNICHLDWIKKAQILVSDYPIR